jgi:hypothetical protein
MGYVFFGGYFIMGLDKSSGENYSGRMGTAFTSRRSRVARRRSQLHAEEMKQIAFVQFKALTKKHIRLPIELVTL